MPLTGRIALLGYEGLGNVATLFGPHYLARRARRGREDADRWREKLGRPSRPAFDDRPVWIHAVSVGESVAALALAEALGSQGRPILLTSATVASAARIETATSSRLVHQFAPLDAAPYVRRFLDHWQPKLALFVESEVWPTTLSILASRKIPRIHVSARLSERSFERWQRHHGIAASLFGRIDLALAQSPRQAERLAALGVPKVRSVGNLKFDAEPPSIHQEALLDLQRAVGAAPVWLAASTHEGEEAIVFATHRDLAPRWPGLITIVAPRHVERAGELERAAAEFGSVAVRSRNELPRSGIYIADTMGEMGTLYALAPIVFLGGSLVPVGGHNPAEPAAFDTALLTGPHHGDMFDPFLGADAARAVTADELAEAVHALLAEPQRRSEMAERAAAVLEAQRGALRRTLDALAPYLERVAA